MPQVSIIVPMYNAERFIERCARSLFEQTCGGIQFVFVDDCSTDGTVAALERVMRQYPHRQPAVVVERLPENQGVACARQRGLELAEGDFVTQIDADDYIAADYVRVMLDKALADGADMVICDYVFVFKDTRQTVNVNLPADKDRIMQWLMTGQLHAGFWNKLVRRGLYVENNVSLPRGLNMLEDKVTMVKLFTYARTLSHVPEAMYYYDKTNASSITSQSRSRQTRYLEAAWLEVRRFALSVPCSDGVLAALEHFRIGLLGSVLYYGVRPLDAYDATLTRRPKVADVISQPVIPANYKLVLTMYSLHLDILVAALRAAKKRLT